MHLLLTALLIISHQGIADQATSAPTPSSQIVVTGTGEVAVAPDQATVNLSIVTLAQEATQAAEENARIQRAALEALLAVGVAEEDIRTIGYAVRPEWHYDDNRNRELIGYEARSTIRVHMDDLEQIGTVIDTSLAAGVNEVSSVDFGVSNLQEAKHRALAAAVEEAHGAAEAIAAAAGGRLGALIEITTEPLREPGVVVMQYASVQQTQITAGDQAVVATVVARWRFVE